MKDTSLRGEVVDEVQLILNQAALEQGGSFDSDVSFHSLSVKIIERYTQPCLQVELSGFTHCASSPPFSHCCLLHIC